MKAASRVNAGLVRAGRVRDRATGDLVDQQQFGGRSLRLLYHSRWGRLLLPMVTNRWFSELAAVPRRLPGSARTIPAFVADHQIDLGEFVVPEAGWRSFADFFVRDFTEGARPIPQNESLLLSPADGTALIVPLEGGTLTVKGLEHTLGDLLGDHAIAAHFAGGTATIVRLTVADAHRFFHPSDGRLVSGRSTNRLLHTVGPLGTARFLLTNSRRWRLFDTERFGRVCLVAVGALLVGRIRLVDRPRCERGDEAGWFELGGSTLVILTQADRVSFDDDLLANSAEGIETTVRAREPIGRPREPIGQARQPIGQTQ